MEERWEPVEEAEKLFRDTRNRVQRENVGLALLPNGGRLIRIGEALDGEIAAWRYGDELRQRRNRFIYAGAATIAAAATVGGFAFLGWIAAPVAINGSIVLLDRRQQQVIDRIVNPGAKTLIVRRWHLDGISLGATADSIELHVRDAHKTRNWSTLSGTVSPRTKDIVCVQDNAAIAMLRRVLRHVNSSGATTRQVAHAASVVDDAGTSDRLLRTLGAKQASLGRRAGVGAVAPPPEVRLAIEMAVNESSEAVALEGELEALRAAWREAEEIAAIADRLTFSLLESRE